MKAVLFQAFSEPPELVEVPDPAPVDDGVVIDVMATGICRSDWHGWQGHDPDISLPHVPGHELAGTVVEIGSDVTRWAPGDRVTVPFVGGCGECPECESGNHQVCDDQFQPGFTHWGSFAEYVSIHRADINLVRLPDSMDFTTAASLGCRFITSFRAVVDQGQVTPGQWVAVHGCGGVGLSAVMIAKALRARVVAIDIAEDKLELARSLGASATVNAIESGVVDAVTDLTEGGAHVSIDALGHPDTCYNSVANLRKRGKHIQVGLMVADDRAPAVPMDMVIAKELEILGSHGMQAHRYDVMLEMIAEGRLHPEKLVGRTVRLDEATEALMRMDTFEATGVTVITEF